MRRFLLAACSISLALVSVCASADQVVLKDGSTIATSKPYTVKGAQALLTLPDGTLVSLPASQIDAQKTAAANAARAAKPAAPAAALQPQTPGEAAKMKSARKATVVLSDEDVQHPVSGAGAAAAGEKGEKGEGDADRVDVTSITSSREAGRVLVSGSLQNTGNVNVSAVSLTIEAVGENNKTVASGFGRIAKDALEPGEKTTFTAEFADDGITNFRCVPRWQMRMPVRSAADGGAPAAGAPGGQEAPAPAAAPPPAPTAPPAAKPELRPQPRGDVAAPPASGPVGSSSNPNAGYLPQPADVVPTPPPPENPK